VYCDGNTTIEGGAVIKYPNDTTAYIEIDGSLTCQTGPYHPAVFTAADDTSIGEDVGDAWAGHGGVIQPGGYANPALEFDGGDWSLHDIRIVYAKEGIWVTSGANANFSNLQIVNCDIGIDDLWDEGVNSEVTLNNCLVTGEKILDFNGGYYWDPYDDQYDWYEPDDGTYYDPGYGSGANDALSGGGSSTFFQLQNCTIDNFPELMGIGDDNSGPGNVDGESSVFTEMMNFGGGSLEGSDDVFWNTPDIFGDGSEEDYYGYPYIQVGGGAYYLNPNVPSNAFGYPSLPIDYSNQSIDQNALGPQPYYTGPGYNYPRLDYVFSQTTVNADLTFQPGTIVVWQGSGLSFSGDHKVFFNGTAGNPCYFLPCNAVQEGGGSGIGITYANGYDNAVVNAAFTRFWAMDNQADFFDASSLSVNAYNCEFWNGLLGGDVTGGLKLNLINCLLNGSTVYILAIASSPDCSLQMQNCTHRGGELGIYRFNSHWEINIVDCAFDGAYDWIDDSYGGQSISCDYNARSQSDYWTLPTGTHDIPPISNFNWQSGPLGNFYQPDDPPAQDGTLLIDAGDRLASESSVTVNTPNPGDQNYLDAFTTQTSQEPDCGIVDIGYHYPANPPYLLPPDAYWVVTNITDPANKIPMGTLRAPLGYEYNDPNNRSSYPIAPPINAKWFPLDTTWDLHTTVYVPNDIDLSQVKFSVAIDDSCHIMINGNDIGIYNGGGAAHWSAPIAFGSGNLQYGNNNLEVTIQDVGGTGSGNLDYFSMIIITGDCYPASGPLW
ncbi:MAG: hypothetical protein ACREFE_17010, partial [Limisphaerales bacterium]